MSRPHLNSRLWLMAWHGILTTIQQHAMRPRALSEVDGRAVLKAAPHPQRHGSQRPSPDPEGSYFVAYNKYCPPEHVVFQRMGLSIGSFSVAPVQMCRASTVTIDESLRVPCIHGSARGCDTGEQDG